LFPYSHVRDQPVMFHDERIRAHKWSVRIALIAIAVGVVISSFSLIKLRASDPPLMAQGIAQGTQPLQSSPAPTPSDKPAESKPGGTRPTTPAPEPARPDPDAQKAGATPVLPAAPAEKIAPPIKDK
jgi:type IV secretory pathway VirB10-like protein